MTFMLIMATGFQRRERGSILATFVHRSSTNTAYTAQWFLARESAYRRGLRCEGDYAVQPMAAMAACFST